MKYSYLLVLALMFIACSYENATSEDPIFCTEEARPGLEITVKEANSNTILIENITVVAIDSSGAETLENFPNSQSFVGAFEKPGRFIIQVESEGYQRFVSQDSIVVNKDACHVITEKREVILSRER